MNYKILTLSIMLAFTNVSYASLDNKLEQKKERKTVNLEQYKDMLNLIADNEQQKVKEIVLLQKGVAVCKEVGDFNEYISEGENGYFLDANNLEHSLEEVIRKAYRQPEQLKEMGIALNKKVIEFFSDTAVNRQPYLDLLK